MSSVAERKRLAHTPGPWHVAEAHITEAGHWAAYLVADGPFRGFISDLQSSEHIGGQTHEEVQANARLICAAPDFHAACDGEDLDPDVTALDWLSALLTEVDAHFGCIPGFQEDPQAGYAALRHSTTLLRRLRAAMEKVDA